MSDLWEKVDNIGDLYLEKELVTGFEPVLFTCRTDSKKRFLVISYNSNDGIFVLCPVTNSNLISMLKNEITMEECYRKSNIIYQTYYDEEADILRVNSFDPKAFPKEKLPEKGAYFSIKSKYIEKYIQSLKNESLYNSVYSEKSITILAFGSITNNHSISLKYRNESVSLMTPLKKQSNFTYKYAA